jgi:hypothetical protein
MPLPRGAWRFNLNGTEGNLILSADAADGSLTGNAMVDLQFKGSFSEQSQTLVMTATVGGHHVGTFTGCLFRTPAQPVAGQDVVATLAGLVQVTHFADIGVNPTPWTARRNLYAWFATFNEVV